MDLAVVIDTDLGVVCRDLPVGGIQRLRVCSDPASRHGPYWQLSWKQALPEWPGVLTADYQRGPTPLSWGHILSYGEVRLDMARRLALSAPGPRVVDEGTAANDDRRLG